MHDLGQIGIDPTSLAVKVAVSFSRSLVGAAVRLAQTGKRSMRDKASTTAGASPLWKIGSSRLRRKVPLRSVAVDTVAAGAR